MATLGKNQMISSSQVQAVPSGHPGGSSYENSNNQSHNHKRLRDESSSNNLNSHSAEPLGTEMGYLDNNREEEDEDYYDE
jgi:hypothetical protein